MTYRPRPGDDPEAVEEARLDRAFEERRERLPLHRTAAGWPRCSTCDGGGCLDCTDPA